MAGPIDVSGPIDMPDQGGDGKDHTQDSPKVYIPGDENQDDENQNPAGGNAPLARPEETNETAPDAAPAE